MEQILDSSATKTNIQAAVQRMASRADADDVCLFYFSGHGSFATDTAPFDETDGYDECMCPYHLYTNQILDDELYNWLNALPTNQ